MVKYDRVATDNSSSDDLVDSHHHDNDYDDKSGVGSISVVSLEEKLHKNNNTSRLVRRTNSQRSLGSHHSLGEEDDDEGESSYLSGEQSPLRGSFDNEEAARKTKLSPTSAGSLSPQPLYPTVGALYKGPSFDLDDDDDEDDINLSRYHLDFKSTDRGHMVTNGSLHRSSSRYGRRFSVCQYLWYKFQSARQKARERRAQLLLQQTDPNWRQSAWFCIMTSCDATDRGILLVAGFIIAWIVAIVLIKHNPALRRNVVIIGGVLLAVRLGTRPLFEYFIRQRMKRRQSSLQPIPQHSPTFRRGQLSIDAKSGIIQEISPYLDRTMNQSNGNGSMTDLELSTMRPTTNDGLPPELQMSNSNGSDPMIAAI